ncbi:RNA polymerase II-associated protein 3 isoform X2 [Ricinus communis]|uniref:RNA polymerase II-associated protein 3 isoform X2 n=1 Tax=Ricinus communis TaxID=3988 RepID=UPI0007722712|nr:RNA polymerase II-associated protein 3 isoform X2 [Ricinus communis]|eukprot:XP_015570381.1 RNA polymerase II-associated protein 3 isoform X2 [Ricinus communis]
MARVPGKHGRDQALDFQGFLNDLQDWELSLKDNKDKKLKPQASHKKTSEDSRSVGQTSMFASRNFDAIDRISSSLMTEESAVDATSEKELGNEYFKQKKFKEAIECYSRSIALSPSAVAYANRAMAYLKIRKFQEAEGDCTEALNLDDRYIKAYSRRATARKELRKFKESMEDSEFALRLEPNNQEIKKQYAEVKSLYGKEILQKAPGAVSSSVHGVQKGGKSDTKVNAYGVNSVSNSTQGTGISTAQKDKIKGSDEEVLVKKSPSVEEIKDKSSEAGSKTESRQVNGSHADATLTSQKKSVQGHGRMRKQEFKASVQELASQAASRAATEAAKNISPPSSAYQFEVSWQSFSGDRASQTRLLKATSPSALPQIFKNALSAPMLIDIIKCVATFFVDDMNLAVKYLQNLAQVPRFNILIMCLSAADKAAAHAFAMHACAVLWWGSM